LQAKLQSDWNRIEFFRPPAVFEGRPFMTSIPEKEIQFNRYYSGEMDKAGLAEF
jgi:hypothetical protein